MTSNHKKKCFCFVLPTLSQYLKQTSLKNRYLNKGSQKERYSFIIIILKDSQLCLLIMIRGFIYPSTKLHSTFRVYILLNTQ